MSSPHENRSWLTGQKVTLELGGKGANIIFEDADISEAVKYAAQGIL
jgi:aldehyde dehydrogenase (NAD+)